MANTYQSSNRRILKNTVIIYARMIIVILASLIAIRYVLLALGVSDFGLYNVVGGLIGMLSFISAAMSNTTSRFINYEMGKGDQGNPNKVFNICLITHICFSLFLILLAETIGVWYVNCVLSVEPGKEWDAMFVFQISTLTACIGLINVPYQSLLIAYEKFALSAGIDIIVTIVRLALVLALVCYKGNALLFYAVSMCAVTLCSFILYHLVAYKKWPDVIRHKLYRDRQYYKEILSFNGYNFLSAAAVVSRNQGSNLIINYFFGTNVNGAFSVARNMQRFVDQFTSNIDQAASPQIIQSYSSNEKERSYYLVGKICRFSLLLYLLVAIPLFYEMDYVLMIWLTLVPEGAVEFGYCILLVCLIATTSSGIVQIVNATGRIKWFKISQTFLFLLCLPVSIFLYELNFPPYTILLLFVLSDIIYRIIQLLLLRQTISFNVSNFIKEAYVRPVIITAISIVVFLLYKRINFVSDISHFLGLCASFIFVFIMIILIGLRTSEYRTIYLNLSQRLLNFKKK